MKPKVKFENISKSYQLYKRQSDKLYDALSFKKKSKERTFTALNDISFEVFEGEAIGVIGINGSGKSTLSNILAGIIPPTSGELTIRGEASLIAINEGLNKQLTGLENIELKCIMMGLDKKEIEEITPQIIEFADIGEFIDQPIKNYSSGMKSRLGFAISTFTNPDVLIIDEALSVGDRVFYKKCIKKINEFKAAGKTIFFISHSMKQTKYISDRVLWLHYGEIKEFGETNKVLENYNEFIEWLNTLSNEEKKAYRKDMLDKQGDVAKQRSYAENVVPTNKMFLSTFLQLSVIFLFTVVSAFFMYTERSPLAFFNSEKEVIPIELQEEVPNNSDLVPEKVDKQGRVKVEVSNFYDNVELTNKVTNLAFGSEVQVLEQIGEVYKVNYDSNVYYTDQKNVEIMKDTPVANFTILEFDPLLPEGLSSSYLFFLAHLNMDFENVKNQLNGLTNEGVNNEGYAFLEYSYDNVTFTFNENGIGHQLIISQIYSDQDLLDAIKNNAHVVSEDGKQIFIPIDGYDIVINLEKKILMITVNNE
ncbi:hypothetical protein B4U37_19455 [Sutcliffiella horikoshii]|uniref:ABC transporter domain-containing protein n=1 Tax=Sutcliffiella horikoshii TaxID=79883 RepID=A0ABN4ZLU5_9BACI|nr:ATP-binding cassette domain-containing protein [Sutcliffiella horikoshii]ART78081.1 hypothetical protein B4U37_19455 [Sutcliffiella horikoshii]